MLLLENVEDPGTFDNQNKKEKEQLTFERWAFSALVTWGSCIGFIANSVTAFAAEYSMISLPAFCVSATSKLEIKPAPLKFLPAGFLDQAIVDFDIIIIGNISPSAVVQNKFCPSWARGLV
jgi:hypothetical protein